MVPLILVPTILGALVLTFSGSKNETVSLDADLCPTNTEEISGSTMLLYDFMKPLGKDNALLASHMLREVNQSMERNTELRVFSLTGTPGSPRTLLKRLCKPYANSDLQVETAAQTSGSLRQCDNLPAKLSGDLREPATAFCGELESLEDTLDDMVPTGWPQERSVQNAYLVEALEDMQLDFRDRPQPHAIHIVSDMMQHAEWYSHLDDSRSNWNYEAFAELLAAQIWGNLNHRDSANMRVEIFYVPRSGLTDQPQTRQAHQGFWHTHFAGSNVTFRDQLTAPAYSFIPLMNVPTETEQADRERLILRQLLLQVREESARFQEQERSQLEQPGHRQQLSETGQPFAEADEEPGEQGEAGEAPRPEQESLSSQPPLGPDAGDAELADVSELPPQSEQAPRLEPERTSPLTPPQPIAEDGPSADASEVPTQPEQAPQAEPERTSPPTTTQPIAEDGPSADASEVPTQPEQTPQAEPERASPPTTTQPIAEDGPSADASEVPTQPEQAPQAEPERASPPTTTQPIAEDGPSADASEVLPPPEVAESGRAAEPTASTEQPTAPEALPQGQPDPDQESVLERTPVTCTLQPWLDAGNLGPDYPRDGRVNMGSATITVRFEVDAQGATVDDEVAVVVDESQSERERYFELFAAEAVAAVRKWQLAFVEPVEAGCVGRQTHTVQFEFAYSAQLYPAGSIR